MIRVICNDDETADTNCYDDGMGDYDDGMGDGADHGKWNGDGWGDGYGFGNTDGDGDSRGCMIL